MEDTIRTVYYDRKILQAVGDTITHSAWEDGREIRVSCNFLGAGISDRPQKQRYRHPAPFFARLFLFIKGGATITTERRRSDLNRGKLHLVPSHAPFTVTYRPSVLYWFHLHICDATGVPIFGRLARVQHGDDPAVFDRVVRSVDSGDARGAQCLVFGAVARFASAVMEQLRSRAHRSSRFDRMLREIRGRPHAGLTVDELAARAHMTRSALSKAFRRNMGISLKEYITMMHLQKAKELLIYTDMTVLQIADALEYEHASYFHRVFRKHTGLTPRAYRLSAALRSARGIR